MDGLIYTGGSPALVWVLISAAVLLIIAALVIWKKSGRRAKRRLQEPVYHIQLKETDTQAELEKINELLAKTGYAFDEQQGIYYSVMDPWQRDVGYCSLYDEWAAPFGMIFDCEPVRFSYNGKKWLIEFWKGQYGITVGGEIGIYNTEWPDLNIPGLFRGTFYQRIADDEMLNMSFTMKRSETILFHREGRHWWLTGFILGEYSEPSALTMEASVTFYNLDMRNAFLDAFRSLGYSDEECNCHGSTVSFTFARPRSKQPPMHHGIVGSISMLRSRILVSRYRELTKGLSGMSAILNTLKARSPALYYFATHVGKQRELFLHFNVLNRYLESRR